MNLMRYWGYKQLQDGGDETVTVWRLAVFPKVGSRMLATIVCVWLG